MPVRSWAPGDTVAESGVYSAHHWGHRQPHIILAIKGEIFPACRACGSRVSFELAEAVPHVTHDFDFAGPSTPFLVKGAKRKGKGKR